MLLILGNTPISKHHCLCLNPCLDIPTKLKFYVKNLVTKHNLDLNCKSPLYRKIGPLSDLPKSCTEPTKIRPIVTKLGILKVRYFKNFTIKSWFPIV